MSLGFFDKDIVSPTEELVDSRLQVNGIQLFIRREDLIHPLVSGNKWRKLKYNLQQAITEGKRKVITKGGPFSNHIIATAVACREMGLESIGVIRGEETRELNQTLLAAEQHGMEFHFVSRTDYRSSIDELVMHLGLKDDFYVVPEGGTNELGIKGCEEILCDTDKKDFDIIVCSFGSGGTAAGILRSHGIHQKIYVYPALKGDFIKDRILDLAGVGSESRECLLVRNGFEFGGYAKVDDRLFDGIYEFHEKTGIVLDPIYTGKMMLGLLGDIDQGRFERGTRILAIHTGGIQGWNGMSERYGRSMPK